MKKVLLIALAFLTLSAVNANADKLVNITHRVESNAIRIGQFGGLTRYMKGYTVTLWVGTSSEKIGELSLGVDKYNRLWIINRTNKRLRIPFRYNVKNPRNGTAQARWKVVILDPGEYEAPDLEFGQGESLDPNIKAICLTSYSDNTSPTPRKVAILE